MNLCASISTFDVLRFYFLQLWAELPFQSVWGGLSPLVLGAFVALYKGVKDSDAAAGVLMGISIAIGVVVLGVMFVLFYVAMILSRLQENQPTGEVKFAVTGDGISIDSDSRREVFSWSDLTTSGSDDQFIWMQFSNRQYRFIPRRSVLNESLFASARQTIQEVVDERQSGD